MSLAESVVFIFQGGQTSGWGLESRQEVWFDHSQSQSPTRHPDVSAEKPVVFRSGLKV